MAGVKSLLGGLGLLGGAAYAISPDDAEAAKLPWKAEAKAQLISQLFEGLRAGNVQPQVFKDLVGLNDQFKLPEYLLTAEDIRHLFEQRMLGNKWDADRVVSALGTLIESPTARGVPNFSGRRASEAVWNASRPRGIFAPVVPGDAGEVRLYSLMDPSPNRVNTYLNVLEDSSGGRMSPPSTFALRERTPSDSATQLHRAKLSAVDEPSPEIDKETIMPDANTVKKILGLGLLGGTGLTAYDMADPSSANAMSYIGPKGMANLFGPEQAKAMLSEAEQMAARGLDNEAIRQANGLFKGMDGKWRWEIDDSGASLTPWTKDVHGQSNISWDKRPGPAVAMSADDFIIHPGLERAYWPTRDQSPDIFYQHILGDGGSRYVPSQDAIYMSAQSRNADQEGLGTALHELQHAIQQREGFARGGSPNQWEQIANDRMMELLGKNPRLSDAYDNFSALDRAIGRGENFDPAEYDHLESVLRALPGGDEVNTLHGVLDGAGAAKGSPVANDLYQRLAGEIEARDVASRMNFTPEQRRATPPDLRDNAIVRYGNGTAASVPPGREWAKEAGNNTPNIAQAVTPSDPFTPSPQALAATAALVSALKAKDQPLEDTYQPADMLTAFLTGGGGLMSRGIQAALDPALSTAFDYVPRFAD